MKNWTYAEARNKLLADLDMGDETFVAVDELIGYFNEGIEEAEAEILKIDEDYFLTSKAVPLVLGTSAYAWPKNMYAYKARGLVYSNGSTIYDVKRFRRKSKFENQAFATQYGAADDYRWFPTNSTPGGERMNLIPSSRETAIVSPMSGANSPILMTLWYIRQANRIPIRAEYILEYEQVDGSVAVSPSLDKVAVTGTYVTGNAVKLSSSGTMPGGLASATVYYLVVSGAFVKFATTLANALLGTVIDITSVGTGVLTLDIAATQAIIDARVLDIPEFTRFVIQVAKVRCLLKGDPRFAEEATILEQLRVKMVDTLTVAQPDDDDTIQGDFSAYTELS